MILNSNLYNNNNNNNTGSSNAIVHSPTSLSTVLLSTLPIITYGEVEQHVKDWISTGCSDYLQHVPKNELLAHCWMVGVDKQVIKKAYCSNGKDELVKALISTCPIVGSSTTITEDLQTFLNRSHDLYSVIHSKGRINGRQPQVNSSQYSQNASAQTTHISNQIDVYSNLISCSDSFSSTRTVSDIGTQESNPIQEIKVRTTEIHGTFKEAGSSSSIIESIHSPELSSRPPRRKIRSSPKDNRRLKDHHKKRLAKSTEKETTTK